MLKDCFSSWNSPTWWKVPVNPPSTNFNLSRHKCFNRTSHLCGEVTQREMSHHWHSHGKIERGDKNEGGGGWLGRRGIPFSPWLTHSNESTIRCRDVMRKDVAGKEKKFPAFPSMEVVEAEMSKIHDGREGSEGEKQRLHNASSFHKCWILMFS